MKKFIATRWLDGKTTESSKYKKEKYEVKVYMVNCLRRLAIYIINSF